LGIYSGGLVKETIPLPGGETAVYNRSGLNFIRHTDYLGSSRLATTWAHAVYSKEAYAPFGETYNEAGTPDRSFTGQDQDVAGGAGGTGTYDFLFRKYDPAAGRWLSPDPKGWGAVDQTAPQSLNRYAYVQNRPMSLIDPDGRDCIYPSGTVVSGDCLSLTDDGVYIDCDGCVTPGSGQFNDNGDLTNYSVNGQPYLYVGNASGIPISNVCSSGGSDPSWYPSSISAVGGGELTFGVPGGGNGVSYQPTWGAFMNIYSPLSHGNYTSSVTNTSVAGGAYAGVGGGLMISNANNVSQLQLTNNTKTISTPIGSVSWSTGGGVWEVQATGGAGVVFAYSDTVTNTTATSNNQPCPSYSTNP
jgi:RHS repeat-associated protein